MSNPAPSVADLLSDAHFAFLCGNFHYGYTPVARAGKALRDMPLEGEKFAFRKAVYALFMALDSGWANEHDPDSDFKELCEDNCEAARELAMRARLLGF